MWDERPPYALRHLGIHEWRSCQGDGSQVLLVVCPELRNSFVMRGRLGPLVHARNLLYFFEPRKQAVRSLTASSWSGALLGFAC